MSPAGSSTPRSRNAGLAGLMPFITVILVISYAIAAYFLLFLPKLGRLVEGGALDTALLMRRIDADQQYLSDLRAASEDFRGVNPQHRQRISGIIPKDIDVPGLMVEMDAVARKNGMALVSIDITSAESADDPSGLRRVRIAMNIAGGTYDEFKIYLADLERVLRIADVQTVVFTPGSANYGIVAHAYALEE